MCAAFDPTTDQQIYHVRERVRAAGVPLPASPPHRPHFSLAAARVRTGPQLERLIELASGLARAHDPIPVLLHEVGRFGRAGVLWLGPAPAPPLARVQREVYRTLLRAGWPSAFGDRSAPRLWIPHCTLATRVAKPLLREVQAQVQAGYQPIHATINALAVILVGGRGDVAHLPLGGEAQSQK